MQDPEIAPLAAEVVDTFDEDYEVDAPNLIPTDHEPDDKSMIDDDDTCQGNDLQIPVPSILKHGNCVSDDEDYNDEDSMMIYYKNWLFKWILKDIM